MRSRSHGISVFDVQLVPTPGYGEMDRAIGHFRRYERPGLRTLLGEVGYELDRMIHVNATSMPGWWLNGVVLKRTSVPGMQARLADRLVPIYRFEQKFDLPFGLSIIAMARRPEAAAA